MQYRVLSRSVAIISVATFAGLSALASVSADDHTSPPPPAGQQGSSTGSSDRPMPPPPPREGSGGMMNGSGGMMMPPPPRDGSGATNGSGTMMPPPPREERSGSGTMACTGTGFAGAWRGSLSLKAEEGDEYEYEGTFRLVDVGADATEKTDDDVVYEGEFYASESEEGALELVLTSEGGVVSDYASLSRVSDNEFEGTVSMDGSEIFVKTARDCGKPKKERQERRDDRREERRPSTGSGEMAVESDGNSVRMGRDGMEVRSSDGSVVRMDANGMEVRREIRKAALSAALEAKIDARLEKMDEDVRHAFYPKVIEKIDALIADMADGKKKGLYIALRDYLESKWYEEFPEDAESAEENVLDDVFSE